MPAENDIMNDILRGPSRAALKPVILGEDTQTTPFSGSREFTVQEPNVAAPDDQFVYEPLPDTPGAWAVYPPGVPCETGQYRISRATPAGVTDFPKMQQALDEIGPPIPEMDSMTALPMGDDMAEPLPEEDLEEVASGY